MAIGYLDIINAGKGTKNLPKFGSGGSVSKRGWGYEKRRYGNEEVVVADAMPAEMKKYIAPELVDFLITTEQGWKKGVIGDKGQSHGAMQFYSPTHGDAKARELGQKSIKDQLDYWWKFYKNDVIAAGGIKDFGELKMFNAGPATLRAYKAGHRNFEMYQGANKEYAGEMRDWTAQQFHDNWQKKYEQGGGSVPQVSSQATSQTKPSVSQSYTPQQMNSNNFNIGSQGLDWQGLSNRLRETFAGLDKNKGIKKFADGGNISVGGSGGGSSESYTKGGWIQNAINPAHKGYCTPITKDTCTPHRKALAMRFKSGDLRKAKGGVNIIKGMEIIAKKCEKGCGCMKCNKKYEGGGYINMFNKYMKGGEIRPVRIEAETGELYVHTSPKQPKLEKGGKANYLGNDGKFHIWELTGNYHSQKGIVGEFYSGGLIIPTQPRHGKINKDHYLKMNKEQKESFHSSLPKEGNSGKEGLRIRKYRLGTRGLYADIYGEDPNIFAGGGGGGYGSVNNYRSLPNPNAGGGNLIGPPSYIGEGGGNYGPYYSTYFNTKPSYNRNTGEGYAWTPQVPSPAINKMSEFAGLSMPLISGTGAAAGAGTTTAAGGGGVAGLAMPTLGWVGAGLKGTQVLGSLAYALTPTNRGTLGLTDYKANAGYKGFLGRLASRGTGYQPIVDAQRQATRQQFEGTRGNINRTALSPTQNLNMQLGTSLRENQAGIANRAFETGLMQKDLVARQQAYGQLEGLNRAEYQSKLQNDMAVAQAKQQKIAMLLNAIGVGAESAMGIGNQLQGYEIYNQQREDAAKNMKMYYDFMNTNSNAKSVIPPYYGQ